MCQSAVFKSNQCEKRNPVQQRFDVRNRDDAVDTTFFFGGHLKIYAKTTTVPVLCLKNMVTLVKSENLKT